MEFEIFNKIIYINRGKIPPIYIGFSENFWLVNEFFLHIENVFYFFNKLNKKKYMKNILSVKTYIEHFSIRYFLYKEYKEELIKLYHQCIFFGAAVPNFNFYLYKKNKMYTFLELISIILCMTFNIILDDLNKKIIAGRKIVRFIKYHYDIEYRLTPFRLKLEEKKYLKLIKNI